MDKMNIWNMKTRFLVLVGIFLVFTLSCDKDGTGPTRGDIPVDDNYEFDQFASSENLEITINSMDGDRIQLTESALDFKPSWSIDGMKLTFFRLFEYDDGFDTWETRIAVVNADGSNLRMLTVGIYPDFNPTWTRDGSNMILFSRYSREPDLKMKVYMISPDGRPGDEILLSDPSYRYHEWACSGLRDGRIFIDLTGNGPFRSFLLTPREGERGTYEEISRPTNDYWHKLSVSPSETKVAYMLYSPGDRPYEDAVICWAKFDVDALEISDQIVVTATNPDCVFEYPRWTHDEEYLIYDSNITGNSQIYAYRLSDGYVKRISPDLNRNYQFGNFHSLPK